MTDPEDQLLARIPEAVRADCGPAVGKPQGAVATIACVEGDVSVSYSQFPTKTAMDAVFQQAEKALGLEIGDCAQDMKAVAEYTIGQGQPAGQVESYVFHGASHIEWTDDIQFVYASAIRDDLADLDLFRWWVEAAGPLESLAGVAPGTVVAKDLASPLPRAPEGSFTAEVTDQDVASLANQFAMLTGTYRLDLSAGSYKLVRSSGATVDEGSYGLAKGSLIALSSTAATCDGTGSYRFALSGNELSFQLAGKDPCQGRGVILGAGTWAAVATSTSPSEPSPSPSG